MICVLGTPISGAGVRLGEVVQQATLGASRVSQDPLQFADGKVRQLGFDEEVTLSGQ